MENGFVGFDCFDDMDVAALGHVSDYVMSRLETPKLVKAFIVWKAKALQNWKYLISTNLPDGMYYELTYNGDKREWYLDVYRKVENIHIPAD